MGNKYDALFRPVKLGGKLELKNRFILAPMGAVTDTDHMISDRYIATLVERAKGGAAMIMPEAFMTTNTGTPSSHYLDNDLIIPGLALLAEKVHAYGAKICAQVSPGEGRIQLPYPGVTPVAPSAQPNFYVPSFMCHELTIDEIHALEESFIPACKRLVMAGFDAFEVHAHAGYLIDQFMSSEWNHRTDEYGGSVENRARFGINIVKNIRKAVGPNMPIIYRMSANHRRPNGRGIEETIEIVKLLKEAGVDVMDINEGCYGETFDWMFPAAYFGDACMRETAKKIKEATGMPVMNAGNYTPDTALDAVESGDVDFIMLGRPLLADPDWVNKLKKGKPEQIRPCLRCNEYCVNKSLFQHNGVGCAVNPRTGHEKEYNITKSENPRNIAVIGSGPAGLEAARVSALKGHTVTVYEKNGFIGGNAAVAATPEFKTIKGLLNWYELQLKDLGVQVVLNKEITPDSPELAAADEIFVALGAYSWAPPIPGMDYAVDICDAHLKPEMIKGDNVVICGGGMSGIDSAIELATAGKKVTVVEMLPQIAGDTCFVNLLAIYEKVAEYGIKVMPGHKVTAIKEDAVVVVNGEGTEVTVPADTVVAAFGLRPNRDAAVAIRDKYPDAILIGDCNKVSTIGAAVKEGFLRALTLE